MSHPNDARLGLPQDLLITPGEVVKQLTKLSGDIEKLIADLGAAEVDTVTLRHQANITESHAFLNASGPMDVRRHQARVEADKDEEKALVAEAVLRHLRARVRALDTRIDLLRSVGTTVRTEMKMLGLDGQT